MQYLGFSVFVGVMINAMLESRWLWRALFALPLLVVVLAETVRLMFAATHFAFLNREPAAPTDGGKMVSASNANYFSTFRAMRHRLSSRVVKFSTDATTLGWSVVSQVITLCGEQLKVANSVMAALSVFVMYSFRTCKESTKVALHDKAMLKNCARLTRVGMLRASNMHVSVWGRMFTPSAKGFRM